MVSQQQLILFSLHHLQPSTFVNIHQSSNIKPKNLENKKKQIKH